MTIQTIKDKIIFSRHRGPGADIIRGRITLEADCAVTDAALSPEEVRSAAMQQITEMLVHELYGDLRRAIKLAFEIECTACFSGNAKVERLAHELYEILSQFQQADV